MLDFTVIEKHETSLDEWLWNNDFRDLSDKVSTIEDHAWSELEDTFEEAVGWMFGKDFGWDDIDTDDLYDFCSSDEFEELVNTTYEVAEKLYHMDDGDKYAELIEFLAEYDPFDRPFDDDEGKIKFCADIVGMIENDKEELISQLKRIREDVGDDTEDAETIDDYIEILKGEE